MKNGKIIQEQIWDPTSQYEVAEKYKVVGRGILRQSTVVQDRETHEILGENVLFSIDRGWLDKYFPGEFTAPNCTSPYGEPQRGGGLHSDDLIMSVLTPIKKIQGEKP